MTDPVSNSTESYLGNPEQESILDADEFNELIVQEQPTKKARKESIKYRPPSDFEDIEEIKKLIKKGDIHGDTMVFKFRDQNIFRYYCSHQKNGCRAALYLELTTDTQGKIIFFNIKKIPFLKKIYHLSRQVFCIQNRTLESPRNR
jgi:hypothetical protein